MKVIILTKKKFFHWFSSKKLNINIHDSLESLEPNKKQILISCNTNIIIPKNIFSNYKIAINIHPALYTFPGRDPHHWASYEKAKFYGATAHIISEKVDQGEIIDYQKIQVNNFTPAYYKKVGNECSKILLNRIYDKISKDTINSQPSNKIIWRKKVFKRKDLLEMCNFENINQKEINLRKLAFAGFEKYFVYGE